MRPNVLNKARRLIQILLQNKMTSGKPFQISNWGLAAEMSVGREVALRDDNVDVTAVTETGVSCEVVLSADDDVDVPSAHLNTLR